MFNNIKNDEMKKVVRVAGYVRVSTEEQAEKGYSIDAQTEEIRKYCKAQGKQLTDVYEDAGISGKEMSKRLKLQELLKDAALNKFDEVVVWKYTRMSRNTRDLLDIVALLEKNNVNFHSLSENFDNSTPTGKFSFHIMASVGELERNIIVENVRLALKQRARIGLHNGGSPCLGYTTVPSEDRKGKNELVIVPSEAEIVKKIYRRYSEGMGLRAIANELNHAGYKTSKNSAFGITSISDILDNPIYKGYVRYARFENWSEKRRKGRAEKPIIAKGKHEAIIDEKLWAQVERRRKERNRVSKRIHDNDNLLTGLLRCPVCGAAMTGNYSYSKKNKKGVRTVYHQYYCGAFKAKGSTVCSANSINADKAESFVLNRVKQILKKPEILNKILESVRKKHAVHPSDVKRRLKELRAEAEAIEQRRGKIIELYTYGDLDRNLLDEKLESLSRDAEVNAKNREMLENEISFPDAQINAAFIGRLLDNFEKVMKDAPRVQKINLLRLMIDRISVKEHNVDKIYLRVGKELENYIAMQTPLADNKARGVFLCDKDDVEPNSIILEV